MNLTLRRLLGAIIAMSLLAVVAFLVARLTIAEVSDDTEEDLLLAENRTQLSLCVEGAGGLDISDEDVERVGQALEEGLESVPFVPSEYSQRSISVGCPPPSADFGRPLSRWDIEGAVVESPNAHRVFVYFLPPDVYTATFPGEAYVRSGVEYVCEGSACHSVTTGLYVPANVEDQVLVTAVLDVLLLLPKTPNPEPTLDWSACDRGEPPHPAYSCDQYEEWQRDEAK